MRKVNLPFIYKKKKENLKCELTPNIGGNINQIRHADMHPL